MSVADIVQIIISCVSLVTTIIISVVVYKLESRNEKKFRTLEEKEKQKELEEKAKIFLIDNDSERDYLPWCVLAANLHPFKKHTRGIYTAFCKCSEKLRDEIVKQAGFEISKISINSWVDECIEKLEDDIDKYNLWQECNYNLKKYFYISYEKYRNLQWNDTPHVFEPINKNNKNRSAFNINKLSIGDYLDEYFYYYIDKNIELGNDIPTPPIDYVWNSQNLDYCDEDKVCMWTMELIENIAYIKNRKNNDKQKGVLLEYTDAQVKNFEDKYYKVLQALFNTYYEVPKDEKIRSDHNGLF